jgi:hypothetical protein
MLKTAAIRQHGWVGVLTLASLSLLWLLCTPAVVSADDPGAVCILQVLPTGRVLSVLVNRPQNFNIAVLVGQYRSITVPVLCDSLNSLTLALANQENHSVDFSVQIFTHTGDITCFKDGFSIDVNGGIGVTFADCP